MIRGLKIRNGISSDAYGRPFQFDLVALRRQWARADKHKAKRTGNPAAVAELAHKHLSPAVAPV